MRAFRNGWAYALLFLFCGLLSACGGGDDAPTPPAPPPPPSADAFTTQTAGLASSQPDDSEPKDIGQIAVVENDTGEPVAVTP